LHVSGRRYEWADDIGAGVDEPLEPAPDWLRELVLPPAPVRACPVVAVPVTVAAAFSGDILDDKAREVRQAPEGHRNHVLNAVSYRLGRFVGAGVLDYAEVESVLTRAAEDAGLASREVASSIASGMKAGQARPFRSAS